MMNRKWVGIALLCLIQPAIAANYKWKDEAGKVHYGATPPAGVQAEEIRTQGPSSSQAQEINKFKAQQKQEEQTKQAQLEAEQKREQILEKKRIWKANCNAAKQKLASLEQKPKVRKQDAYGNLVIIPSVELKRSIKDAKQEVDLYCTPPSFENE